MFKENNKFEKFESKVWLSSPTMHGPEIEYVKEAYETNWMSTVGKNINEVERMACRLCYPVVEKDVADFSAFNQYINHGVYFDWNTPYGYGGPLADVEQLTCEQQEEFRKELFALAKERNVVSQFLRFHPLLQNQAVCHQAIENVYIKDTIFINLDTSEDLMVQMDTKNRNLIRKAIKNGITIV